MFNLLEKNGCGMAESFQCTHCDCEVLKMILFPILKGAMQFDLVKTCL